MPDRTQDLTNHRKVAQACKNYTDTQISESEERMKWYIGEIQTTTQDDNTTAYQKTVPANATRVKIKKIYGNSVKYAPTTASDTTIAYQKNVPSYSPSIDRASASMNILGGMSYKSNNLWNSDTSLSYEQANNNYDELQLQAWVGTTYVRVLGLFYWNTRSSISFTLDGTFDTISIIRNGDVTYIYKPFTISSLGLVNGNTYTLSLTNNRANMNDAFTVTDIMLNDGSTALPYEPYFSDISDTVVTNLKSEGQNRFDINSVYSDTEKFTITGSKVTSSSIIHFYNTKRYFKQNEIGKTFTFKVLFTSNCIGTGFRVGGIINGVGVNGTIISTFPNYSTITVTPTSTNDCLRIDFSDGYNIEIDKVMLNEGSDTVDYKPYFSDTLAIDSNIQALDGYGKSIVGTNVSNTLDFNSKKFIKYRGDVDLGTLGWAKDTTTRPADSATINAWYAQLDDCKLNADGYDNMFLDGYTVDTVLNVDYGGGSSIKDKIIGGADNNHRIWLYNSAYQNMTQEELQAELSGKILQFELATPVETDISQYLTTNEIEIEPNGTLSFESTYNAYVPSDVSYNGVIKHALATAIQQSRNGVVIKTINLPYQASDGWGIGSVRNVRDFTTNKRGTNVGYKDLGESSWTYNTQSIMPEFYTELVDGKQTGTISAIPALCTKYSTVMDGMEFDTNPVDKTICAGSAYWSIYSLAKIHDTNFNNRDIFKSAMSGVPLFYELDDEHKTETDITPIDNILVVEAGDTLTFVNEEGLPVPSDLTYRIEVARV